ncbi:MAG: preprotein translocase subunit SecE [Ferrimicrobium sp.]
MNRETKRLAQRQSPPTRDRQDAARRLQSSKRPKEKGRIRRYFGSVRSELRAVDWPSRVQVRSYASVVFVTLVLVVGLIFLLNVVFSRGVAALYG